MTTSAPTLPPPLSAPPSPATLQGLLDALRQPMQRGVPTPPRPDPVVEEVASTRPSTTRGDGAAADLTRLEQLAASRRAIETPTRGGVTAPDGLRTSTDAAGPVERPAALTWSAGRAHHPRRTAALAAVAVVAGTVTALVAAGELALP